MSELITAIEAAVRAAPDSAPLRLHLAQLLIDDGQAQRAIAEIGTVLASDPASAEAKRMLTLALSASAGAAPTNAPASTPAAPASPAAPSPSATEPAPAAASGDLDWKRLEAEIGVEIDPPFVTDGAGATEPAYVTIGEESDDTAFFEEPESEKITLDDVGGLIDVKERLRLAFLEPMRNPEIAKAYGKSLRGGLLLYGPPGTGKTFLARAVAGELDAHFLSVSVADVLDGVMGESEKNVRRIFDRARELAPCVLFIDELDALGGKRSGYSNVGWMRNVVNQLLQEMDGVGTNNDGVFLLAATNHPWDVDSALLRPGRFDRILLVTAPDAPARAAIVKHALKGRPIAGIDLDEVVTRTHGFSGADLTHLAATAAEKAMSESLATGVLRPINMHDMRAALDEIKPSIGPWLQSARNVVDFANLDGRYDDLKDYLEAEKRHGKRGK